jgi:hypothetical protein|tara:strand:+ start:4989 stop:5855 length:867 start_codon:yes stop_codon:yes gene_type:complete
MYFPLSQITTNLNTGGEDFYTQSTGVVYVGSYFKTSKGLFYTGTTPNDGPNQLLIKGIPKNTTNQEDAESQSPGSFNSEANLTFIPQAYASASTVKQSSTTPVVSSSPKPTEKDYNNTKFKRYFLKRTTNYIYKEISKDTYSLYKNKSNLVQYSLYTPLSIDWVITGPLLNAYKTNINIVTLATKNERWLGFIESFKGRFARYFKNIENKSFYTNGGELKVDDTNEEYIGYYHANPFTGNLMEGRVHVDTPHRILTLIQKGEVLSKKFISQEGEVGTSTRRNIPRGLY